MASTSTEGGFYGKVNLQRRSAGVAAGLLVVCLAAGCTQLGPAEKETLTQASQCYSRGDLSGACTRLERLIAEHENAVEIGEAYYLRGLCRAKSRQYGPATRDFETAIKKSHRDDLTMNARISLASLAFQRGAWDQAVEYYKAALPMMPASPPKDEVLYAAGLAMQRVGQWREATLCFSEILNRFRDRPIATDARRKAAWPHTYFAIQLGAFRESANAEREVRKWRSNNLDATQEALPVQGQAMWVIMTGRYRTFADASAALSQVRKMAPSAYIIP